MKNELQTAPDVPVESGDLLDGANSRTGGRLGMMAWMATEGGRKCPMCGRYAKTEELGNLSRNFGTPDGGWAHISMYGHLPGFGCNQSSNGI